MPFLGQLPVGTGDAGENLGNVAAIVSVLEEGNVELGTDGEQEALEGGGPLGKGKHEELLVGHAGAAAAEVANVALGELVGGEVGGSHGAVLADALEQAAQLVGALGGGGGGEGDADEDVGDVAALGVAVGELGDGPGHDGLDEAGKGAGSLGDAAGEQHLLALAEGGALGDEAQAVKVHVGARGDGDEGAGRVRGRVAGGVLFEAGNGQRAGGLEPGPRVVVHVLDGGANLVGGDLDDVVDALAGEAKGLLADRLDGGAVGKQADLFEHDALAPLERLGHGVCVVGLDADNLDVGRHALHVDADAGNQAAAADAAKDGLDLGHVDLGKELVANGALSGNHVRVVKGRDVDEPVGGGAAGALVLGGVKVGAVQDDVAAEAGDVGVLDARGALGHDDGGGNLELAGRVGDALRVVAGGAADDALPGPRGVEVGHLVVGAAQLEAKDGLLVLALEQHGALEPVAEVDGVGEGRGLAGFVDARCGGEDHA
ncbi:hypothetical protein BM221_003461 [Beauveria bassiana]|uniref:Uncharacterized protein n=1 Tax=Beauveria bassiana TaxID=176275 RepID=A0A2N6NUQ9_BEABA|nr:hypothetical protein BM221_003461 [Beauveria bassiana]